LRPYGTVSPLFWTGNTGKKLRADREAQVVAMYLMTSPHSHQTGLYYLPRMYLAHETGIPLEGANKALLRLEEDAFCVYDDASEWIWVREMAAWQIGSGLKPTDKRCEGVHKYLESVPKLPFLGEFVERYGGDFHLVKIDSPLEAPQEGHSSNRTGTEQDIGASPPLAKTSSPRPRRSSRVPAEFSPDVAYAASVLPDIDAELEVQKFRDWEFKTPKSDWSATWRNWIGTCRDTGKYARKKLAGGANGIQVFRAGGA
jgi:hypothetical protein